MALAVALWLLLLPVYLRWRRVRNERGWPTWIELTTERDAQYRYLRDEVVRRLADIDGTCDVARRRHASGEEDDALRVLRAIVESIETFVPDLAGRLREWTRVAAALHLLAPLPPVPPRTLHAARLKGLATAWHAIDMLLVTTRERFRLRAFMLRSGLRLVATGMREVLLGRGSPASRWRRVEALRADLGTLSHASLDTYRGLLASLQLRPPAPA